MTETNHFREGQKRVIQQQAALRAEAKPIAVGTTEEREQTPEPTFRSPRPGEPAKQQQEPFKPTISPMPTRIKPQALPGLKSIKADLTDLAKEVEESKADFVKANASLDEWFAPLKEAEAISAKLRAELAEAEQKVQEMVEGISLALFSLLCLAITGRVRTSSRSCHSPSHRRKE